MATSTEFSLLPLPELLYTVISGPGASRTRDEKRDSRQSAEQVQRHHQRHPLRAVRFEELSSQPRPKHAARRRAYQENSRDFAGQLERALRQSEHVRKNGRHGQSQSDCAEPQDKRRRRKDEQTKRKKQRDREAYDDQRDGFEPDAHPDSRQARH